MSGPIKLRKAIICDCADCGGIVDITPFTGFDSWPEDGGDADRQCPMCGKIVCESCFGDWDTIMTEDGDECGGEYVCVECGENLMGKAKP